MKRTHQHHDDEEEQYHQQQQITIVHHHHKRMRIEQETPCFVLAIEDCQGHFLFLEVNGRRVTMNHVLDYLMRSLNCMRSNQQQHMLSIVSIMNNHEEICRDRPLIDVLFIGQVIRIQQYQSQQQQQQQQTLLHYDSRYRTSPSLFPPSLATTTTTTTDTYDDSGSAIMNGDVEMNYHSDNHILVTIKVLSQKMQSKDIFMNVLLQNMMTLI
jgi:hypothetical protein